jgi:hypothetical protein
MPQNPVNTTLFVSKIIGDGISVSPANGTGVVTITAEGSTYNPADVAITGGAINGTPVGGTTPAAVAATTLSASGAVTGAGITAALLAWFQANAGTFTANGATAVTVAATEITANSQILITLKTVGGTVGAIPHVATITPGTGFTVVGTALDTSVYNFTVIG